MYQEWLNRIALTWANKTRLRGLRQVLDKCGSATEVVRLYPELLTREAMLFASKEFEFIEKHQIKTYFYKDDNYPYRLAQCADAPLVLYAKGNVDVNPQHVVSVIGTRMPSERGKEWCRQLIHDLAAQVPDLTIVSGLAYGIDVVAHKAAMESGISTIIIPAHGLDRIYPIVHRSVAIEALNRGGILTEYTTGIEPERYNFVARNRIIAGMADALVVVESKSKGGSLITAQMAQDYSRDIFALPGRFNDSNSEGCNNLIKMQRAQLITSADDLVQSMQWQTASRQPVQMSMIGMLDGLTECQRVLLDKLGESENGLHVNQLVLELRLPYNDVASELMMLELKGHVRGLPGGIWRMVER